MRPVKSTPAKVLLVAIFLRFSDGRNAVESRLRISHLSNPPDRRASTQAALEMAVGQGSRILRSQTGRRSGSSLRSSRQTSGTK